MKAYLSELVNSILCFFKVNNSFKIMKNCFFEIWSGEGLYAARISSDTWAWFGGKGD